MTETPLTNKEKLLFGGFVISIMTGLQIYAWHCGHDGAVFAITSSVIGLISGAILGFTYRKSEA